MGDVRICDAGDGQQQHGNIWHLAAGVPHLPQGTLCLGAMMNCVGSAHDLGPRTFSRTSSAFCSESKVIKTRSLMVPTPWLVRSNRSVHRLKPRRHGDTPRGPIYSAIFRTRHWLKVQHGADPYSRDRVGVKSMTTSRLFDQAVGQIVRRSRTGRSSREGQPRGDRHYSQWNACTAPVRASMLLRSIAVI